jgi:hypothetical protein
MGFCGASVSWQAGLRPCRSCQAVRAALARYIRSQICKHGISWHEMGHGVCYMCSGRGASALPAERLSPAAAAASAARHADSHAARARARRLSLLHHAAAQGADGAQAGDGPVRGPERAHLLLPQGALPHLTLRLPNPASQCCRTSRFITTSRALRKQTPLVVWRLADHASVVHALRVEDDGVQAGRISIVGVYSGFTNGFNIGERPLPCTTCCAFVHASPAGGTSSGLCLLVSSTCTYVCMLARTNRLLVSTNGASAQAPSWRRASACAHPSMCPLTCLRGNPAQVLIILMSFMLKLWGCGHGRMTFGVGIDLNASSDLGGCCTTGALARLLCRSTGTCSSAISRRRRLTRPWCGHCKLHNTTGFFPSA